MSWGFIEGKFNGVTEKKTLNNGTNLAVIEVTEEARGAQEAAVFSITCFKEVAASADSLAMGTPVVVKYKIDSRAYKDKNGNDRRATELKGFAIYKAPSMPSPLPLQSSNSAFVPF